MMSNYGYKKKKSVPVLFEPPCAYKQQLHIFYMSYNNVGHLISKTVTTLQHFATLHHTSPNYTSLPLSTLHFLSFTLHYPIIWLNPFTFSNPFTLLLTRLHYCEPQYYNEVNTKFQQENLARKDHWEGLNVVRKLKTPYKKVIQFYLTLS